VVVAAAFHCSLDCAHYACIEERSINLLLVGGAGVGKSTWINAFANYCSYGTLREAEEAGGKFPVSFSNGADVGESVVRSPREYVFKCQNKKINIIDTPGLVHSPTQDTHTEHVSNILRLLSAYTEIHAICIFLTANQTEMSEAFQYTLNEILGRLDKSARNNIIFILTNSASTNFIPRNAQSVLEAFLKSKKLSIPLPPQKETVYCFDNGFVQYLVDRKNKIPRDSKSAQDALKNWRMSRDSAKKMIQYVRSLVPLPLTAINAMYDAECTIGILSRIVLETLQCIVDNVRELERRKNEAETMRREISSNTAAFEPTNVANMMFVWTSRIVRREIDRMNVICESSKCRPTNGNAAEIQICCNGCVSQFMYFCEKMTLLGVCRQCGCAKSKHRWITTQSEVVTERESLEEEKGRQAPVTERSSFIIELEKAILAYPRRMAMHKADAEQMLRTCAKLNTYVNKNALLTSSGADELTRSLENRQETDEAASNIMLEIRTKYSKFLSEETGNDYTPNNVEELIQGLYRMLIYGKDLKAAMDVEESARRKVEGKTRATTFTVLLGFLDN